MPKYARRTKVSALQSRMEIERLLRRYGADSFGFAAQPGRVTIGFRLNARMVRFSLTVPTEEDSQEYRQRWRALMLVIKSKLESVECGIEEFDAAFLPQIVLPDGRTLGEVALPQVKHSYTHGKMPPLLAVDNQ